MRQLLLRGQRGPLEAGGLDVPDLSATFARMQALGIKFGAEPKVVNNGLTGNASLTDPWGTYIEITARIGPK